MNRRQVLSFLGCAGALPVLYGADEKSSAPNYPNTRAFLRKFVDDGQANGAIGCVWRHGKVDLEAIVGWMDSDLRTPMRGDAIFYIASLSKPVTGVSAMMLIEEGKLRLDDPIDRWLPELANRNVMRKPDGPLDDTVPSPRPILVSDLLSMHMGLGAYGAPGPIMDAQEKLAITAATDPDLWLKQLGELPLQYAPGEVWLNDTSVDVLGQLIRRITGSKRLNDFQHERIFAPLGMADTDFYVPNEKLDRAAGFPPEGKKPLIKAPPKVESGGDGLYSTMSDYLRFARMLANGGSLDNVKILKPESLKMMTTDKFRPDEHQKSPYNDRYPGRGFGYTLSVRTESVENGPSVGAYNWNGTVGTWFMIDPQRDAIILLMIQHPTSGSSSRTGQAYISKIEENNRFQAAVYADLLSAS